MPAVGQVRLPVSVFTGILSSAANICIIFLVVYYGEPGLMVSLAMMMIQFPFCAELEPVYAALTGDQCAITNIRIG